MKQTLQTNFIRLHADDRYGRHGDGLEIGHSVSLVRTVEMSTSHRQSDVIGTAYYFHIAAKLRQLDFYIANFALPKKWIIDNAAGYSARWTYESGELSGE